MHTYILISTYIRMTPLHTYSSLLIHINYTHKTHTHIAYIEREITSHHTHTLREKVSTEEKMRVRERESEKEREIYVFQSHKENLLQ